MNIEVKKYRLKFKFVAGTSRGAMTYKDSWFIKLFDNANPDLFGIGECGPLKGLSPDLEGDLEKAIADCISYVSDMQNIQFSDVNDIVPDGFPALRFALETSVLDLYNGGKRVLYDNEFTNSRRAIPINGLVWMGDKALMHQRINEKIEDGFTCIKIKIGAINFDEELELLKHIRDNFSSDQITIRLDANGAFNQSNVLNRLERLSRYDVHSIEQPVMAGDWELMGKICNDSPIPIALDEELIRINGSGLRVKMLEDINPAYIILKPTLLGGLTQSAEWIDLAASKEIGWWITSALESNIGLNAIAQFVANNNIKLPQGLGTGQLFHNNINSPLSINNGNLVYGDSSCWDLSAL